MEGEDAVIADGDPVGISAEVLKDTLDAIEGRLTIDDPLFTIELASESLKVLGRLERADLVGEYKSIRLKGSFEKVKELPFEQGRQDPDGDEKPFSGGDPTGSVRGESAPGDNAMDMGMVPEVLAPGVQNPDTADLCAEMFRVLSKLRKGFGDRTEEKIVQDLAVQGDQGMEFGGESEDHMEICNGEEILRAGLDPSLFP